MSLGVGQQKKKSSENITENSVLLWQKQRIFAKNTGMVEKHQRKQSVCGAN